MALDLSGFEVNQPDYGKQLENIGNHLEQKRYRDEQLALKKEARQASTSNFLTQYLDKKDFATGTAYDPMLVNQLHEAMQTGIELAGKGADIPTIMMALGPQVSKINKYASTAKLVSANIDNTIKSLKESQYKGFDFATLKDKALRSAFYDDKGFNPDVADPSVNYAMKIIDENPQGVTTTGGLDEFAKSSPISKTLTDIQSYTPEGMQTRNKVHLIGQNYLVPDVDHHGVTKGLVPKYETATSNGQPLMHDFQENGKKVSAPIRLLDEEVFDNMMNKRPDVAAYIKGQTLDYIKAHDKDIRIDSPEAKRLARMIAYDELNARKSATIENAEIQNKPSPMQIKVNVGSSPEYMNMVEKQAEAKREGTIHANEAHGIAPGSNKKTTTIGAIGKIFSEDPDYKGDEVNFGGRKLRDVGAFLPGGKLKTPASSDVKYGKVMYDENKKSIVIETLKKDKLGHWKSSGAVEVEKKDALQFAKKIAATHGSNPEKAEQELGIHEDAMQSRLDNLKKKKSGGIFNGLKSLIGLD